MAGKEMRRKTAAFPRFLLFLSRVKDDAREKRGEEEKKFSVSPLRLPSTFFARPKNTSWKRLPPVQASYDGSMANIFT